MVGKKIKALLQGEHLFPPLNSVFKIINLHGPSTLGIYWLTAASRGFTWPDLGFREEVVERFFTVLFFKEISHYEITAQNY